MKVYVLDTGYLETDKNNVVGGATMGTYSQPYVKNEGTLIFPQDCVYSSEIYGPPAKVSGLLYDSLSFFKSINKVRALEKKYDAKVFFAHDEEFFKTIKTAPEFYE